MHEPPVQPDRCALSGNYRLESNPVRHDLSPLAAATGNWFRGVCLELMHLLRLNWKNRFWWLRSSKPVTRLANLPGLANLRKTTCQGGFFVYWQQITRRKKGSQEDPLIFLLKEGKSPKNSQPPSNFIFVYLILIHAFIERNQTTATHTQHIVFNKKNQKNTIISTLINIRNTNKINTLRSLHSILYIYYVQNIINQH